MTTDLQSATVDDLLAYLRSSDPVPRRAVQRAATRPTTPRANVERRPLSPVQAATLRNPPGAATRYREANRGKLNGGDYKAGQVVREHAEALERAECRVVAWLVCRALGDAWRFERADDDNRHHRLVHRATCATLTFSREWNDSKRYKITPENVYRTDSMPRSITVSGERSPASIARDIERRLIAAGLFDQNAALLSAGHERRATEVKRRRQCLAVARAYGGTLAHERRWKHGGYPAATFEHFGRQVDDYENERPGTTINVQSGYSGLELTIETYDTRLAVQIAELVRDYYK